MNFDHGSYEAVLRFSLHEFEIDDKRKWYFALVTKITGTGEGVQQGTGEGETAGLAASQAFVNLTKAITAANGPADPGPVLPEGPPAPAPTP